MSTAIFRFARPSDEGFNVLHSFATFLPAYTLPQNGPHWILIRRYDRNQQALNAGVYEAGLVVREKRMGQRPLVIYDEWQHGQPVSVPDGNRTAMPLYQDIVLEANKEYHITLRITHHDPATDPNYQYHERYAGDMTVTYTR